MDALEQRSTPDGLALNKTYSFVFLIDIKPLQDKQKENILAFTLDYDMKTKI